MRVYLRILALAPSLAFSQAGTLENQNYVFRSASRLIEIAPHVTEVEVRKGDPFIEVFISGFAAIDCFDVREYYVEKGETSTKIIPRFRRSQPDKPCPQAGKIFREKAADLDPNSQASNRVEVLGYLGWHTQVFNRE